MGGIYIKIYSDERISVVTKSALVYEEVKKEIKIKCIKSSLCFDGNVERTSTEVSGNMSFIDRIIIY